MKKYTKVYMDYFGYDVSDFICCETCGAPATEISHIHARSIRKDLENDITNIMASCRPCHIKYGDRKHYKEYLQDVHNKFMKDYGRMG